MRRFLTNFTFIEFEFNSSNNAINLNNITIGKQKDGDSFAYLLIKGIDLTGRSTQLSYPLHVICLPFIQQLKVQGLVTSHKHRSYSIPKEYLVGA